MATPDFKGNYWTFAYSIPPNSATAVIAKYNDRDELLATHSWERLSNAITQKDTRKWTAKRAVGL